MTALSTFSFHETQFSTVDQGGQIWLRASEIAQALGYASSDAVGKLYDRNADEFNESMTRIIDIAVTPNSTVSKNLQNKTRIFSLRGAHLIAMFARTKIAKEFRKWVLDILDRETTNKRTVVTTEQKNELQQIVAARCYGSPRARGEMWTRHNNHFNIHSYHELLAVHFEDSKRYLTSMVLNTKVQPEPQQERLPAPFLTLPTQVGCFLTVCDPDGTTTIYDASNYELVEKGLMEKFHQDWDLAAKAIMHMYTTSFAKVGYRIHEQNNTLPVLKKFVQSK